MSLVSKSYYLSRGIRSTTQVLFNFRSNFNKNNPVHQNPKRYSHADCPERRLLNLYIYSDNNYNYNDRFYSTSPAAAAAIPPRVQQAENIIGFSQFVQEENRNADRFIRNSPSYKGLVFQPLDASVSGSWTTVFHPTVKKLIQIAMNEENLQHPIAHEVNNGVVDEILLNLKSFKDPDLLQVLFHLRFFAPCYSIKDPVYYRLWKAIDEECCSRMSTWTFDYLFVVADLWNGLSLARNSSFHWSVVKKCFRKCDRLTKEQFIRFMFCLNLSRRLPESISTYDVEFYLNKVSHQLNAQEVAVVAMAFFKTETHLNDKGILEKLIDIAIVEAKTLQSIEVAAIAKLARFCSSPNKSRDVVIRFQEAFLPEIGRLSIPACTHLALVGTNCQAPHLKLVNSVVNKLETTVSEARLKEIERISLAMTMFNADCDDLCNLIVGELRKPERAEEIRTYGRCLPAILHYLSLREIFPEDLISMALAEDFRKTYYGSKWETHQRELLCLDFATELEIPNYNGARLDNETREKLTKINFTRLKPFSKNKVSLSEKALRTVVQVMEDTLGGHEFFYPCNILPQHSSVGVVYCTNDRGEVVKIPQDYRLWKDFEVKYIPSQSENIRYNVIFLCTRNICLVNGSSEELSGQGRLQVRQLMKMGYCVHTVMTSELDRDMCERIKVDVKNILAESCVPTQIVQDAKAKLQLNVVQPVRAF